MATSGGSSNQQNIVLNIDVTGQDEVKSAKQDVDNLNKSSSQAGQVNMAGPVKTLRQELRSATNDLQRMAVAGQQNTREYTNAARRVAELRDQIQETNATVASFDPDNKFKVFGQAATFGAKAVQGYAGAMSFLGVESGTATQTLVKLQGIMAFSDAISSIADLNDTWKNFGRILGLTTTATQVQTAAQTTDTTAVTENTAANVANVISVEASATAQTANATATEAAAVATETASVATKGFGLALKAIGIGLIIAAIVLLVENWNKIKKVIDSTFPSLGGVDKLFDKIKSTAVGMGVAVFDIFKGIAMAISDLVQGNFSAALDDVKKGFDVQKNFTDAYVQNTKEQLEDARLERVKKEIEGNARIIAERKALGKDTYNLEVANQKKKIETLDKDDKDYKTKKADEESALTVLINTELKKRSDKAKELLKTDLDNIKKNNEDAKKTIAEGSATQRDLEIKDLELKYTTEFKLLEKRKKDLKDYNKEYSNLVDARKLEESKINKKYDDAIKAYDDEVNSAYLTSFEKKAVEINKKADALLIGASPANRNKVEQDRTFQLNQNTAESKAADSDSNAKVNLTQVEDKNRPNDKDTPDEAKAKIEAISKAKFDADNAAFELKKSQLTGQNNELAQLEADHQKSLTDINQENSDARKAIDEKEKEARLNTMEAVASGVGTLSQIVGEQTLAGKSLAVAQATIDTYAGATKAYSQGGVYGFIGAAAVIVAGLNNVRKIISTKVPVAGGGNGGNIPTPVAPVINSTILQQSNNGTSDIVNAVNTNTVQTKNVRAYIVNKDLEKQKTQQNFNDNQSTY